MKKEILVITIFAVFLMVAAPLVSSIQVSQTERCSICSETSSSTLRCQVAKTMKNAYRTIYAMASANILLLSRVPGSDGAIDSLENLKDFCDVKVCDCNNDISRYC